MARYRLDELAIISQDKKKLNSSEASSYISLDDISTGSLTLSTWGNENPGDDEKLVVKKGDVLCARRDVHLHKLAISPIDGYISSYGMVLRPNESIICREYFPYFINSDIFINKMSSLSVGTYFKNINTKDLNSAEFDIPDINTQHELANKLCRLSALIDNYNSIIADSNKLADAYYYENILVSEKSNNVPLFKLLEMSNERSHFSSISGRKYTTFNEISGGTVGVGTEKNPDAEFYGYHLHQDQLICNRKGFTKGQVAIVPEEHEGSITSLSPAVMFINKELVLPQYLLSQLQSESFTSLTQDVELSVENWNNIISHYTVKVPPLEVQSNYLQIIEFANSNIHNAKRCIEQSNKMIQAISCEGIE